MRFCAFSKRQQLRCVFKYSFDVGGGTLGTSFGVRRLFEKERQLLPSLCLIRNLDRASRFMRTMPLQYTFFVESAFTKRNMLRIWHGLETVRQVNGEFCEHPQRFQ